MTQGFFNLQSPNFASVPSRLPLWDVGHWRVPMLQVLKGFDGPEILMLASATTFLVVSIVYFF